MGVAARPWLRLPPLGARLDRKAWRWVKTSAPSKEDQVLSHSDPATGLPVGPRPTPTAAGAEDEHASQTVLALVLKSVDDDKAEDIVQIDLRGRSEVADYMVICSGRSSRQVAAISEKLADRLKQDLKIAVRMEGKDAGDWVLIDAGDVIVHVFRPEVREFYQLEKMWLPVGSTASGAPRSASA
jgi:ribosome-associated protein